MTGRYSRQPMGAGGPRETEVKFRLEDRAAFERRLASLGAREISRERERNVLFDDEEGSLKARGCALRLRTTETGSLLTFKGKPEFHGGVKSRLELESAVAHPGRVEEILAALGYRPCFTYEKRRATWRFAEAGRPVAVLDETPIGLFAELEGEEAAVRDLAKELGVDEAAFIADSYPILYLKLRQGDPSLPPDMVFP